MRDFYCDLKDMLDSELEQIVASGNDASLDDLYKLMTCVGFIDDMAYHEKKIGMLQKNGSYDGMKIMGRRYGNSYNNGSSYDNGSSYRMGRRGYNYNNGYSREDAKEDMMNELNTMMNEATSEKKKEAIKHVIEAMREI